MIGKRSPEKSVTEVRLVEAAAQLFARQGFKATTTKEIAQLADLNEATLFRYFPRKPDLFMAALESCLGRIKLSRDLQAGLASDGNPALVVPKIVEFISNSLLAHPEVRHLLHVARFELSDADTIVRETLGPIFDLLTSYFKRCVDNGSIRKVEPARAALWLLGGVAADQSFCELFTSERPQLLESDQTVAAYAALCLQGLRPFPPVSSSGEEENGAISGAVVDANAGMGRR